MKNIGLACDHAGYALKEKVAEHLLSLGYGVKDYGTYSAEATDYPDYAHALAKGIENGECELGVSICGSANGIAMTLNKHQGIRAAVCWSAEIARLARAHNDANVCSLPARFIGEAEALEVLEQFLAAGFDGGRHARRVAKIPVCG